MRVTRLPDASAFLAAADEYLVAREALLNLPIAIAGTCLADPTRYPGPNYFAVAEDAGAVCGVSMMTPPHRLQVYVPPGAAVAALAEDVACAFPSISGVVGPVDVAEEFAALWRARHSTASRTAMDLRGFELREVTPAPPVRGAMRLAGEDDLATAESWYRAFHEDAHVLVTTISPEEQARRAVRDRRLWLWEDGRPVAQTAIVGGTPHGARVGAVYTPKEFRRRGYATALVEQVSRRVLADGRRLCFLFTDLANPVSNSIYPKVGYRPIGDLRDIEFV